MQRIDEAFQRSRREKEQPKECKFIFEPFLHVCLNAKKLPDFGKKVFGVLLLIIMMRSCNVAKKHTTFAAEINLVIKKIIHADADQTSNRI